MSALEEAEDLLAFHEGSAKPEFEGAHPTVRINGEDFDTILRLVRAALEVSVQRLDGEQSAAFVGSLIDPPEPNARLKLAVAGVYVSDEAVMRAAWAWLRALPGYEEGKGVPPTERELLAIRAALQSQAPPSPVEQKEG